MKNGWLLLVLTSLVVGCHSNPGTSASGADGSVSGTIAQQNKTGAKSSYFILLKGTIGTYPVTVYLYAMQHNYSGYYYYDSKQLPIYFSGEDSAIKDKISLTTMADSGEAETFLFSFDGAKGTGNWKMGGKTLPLSLSKGDVPVSFEYVGWADSVAASATLPNPPYATSELSSVWPTGSSATDEFIKTQIAKLINDKEKSRDIHTILSNSGKSFLDDYRNDTTLDEEDIKANPGYFSYDESGDVRIVYLSPKLLSLSNAVYSYTGGVHGNYGTAFLPLDIVNNKVLALSDILTTNGIRQLRPLLEKSYRRDRNLQPSQPLTDGGLFDNRIEPNKNFYVTGKGLLFDYTPYEIASYADGEIQIMISYSDLGAYLQPSFKSLLQ